MSHRRAFTLIELLVVIAIIAILAAILFPVFAQAKVAAKKTQDLSNQKNITLGVIMYTSDNDDLLPACQFFDGTGWSDPNLHQVDWKEAVYPYIKSGDKTNSNRQVGRGGIWIAPGNPKPDIDGGSYAVSYDLFRDEWYDSQPGPFNGIAVPHFSTTSIDKLAEKVLIMHRGVDGEYWNWSTYTPWEWDWVDWLGLDSSGNPTNPNPARNDLAANVGDCDRMATGGPNWAGCGMHPRYRYNRVLNEGMIDGHAQAFKRTETSSTLNWYKNIYIKEAANSAWSSWYPY